MFQGDFFVVMKGDLVDERFGVWRMTWKGICECARQCTFDSRKLLVVTGRHVVVEGDFEWWRTGICGDG